MSGSGDLPRLGFVGVGWIGAMRMDAVAESGAGVVAAVCDAAPERTVAAAGRHAGAVPVDDIDEMVMRREELGLDAVVIATPNALHASQAIAALESGLAVFCQKPLALDAAQAGAIVEAARAADRLLAVDYSYRFTDGLAELHRAARAGELGRIFQVESVFHNAYGPDKAWCHDPALAGGGALMDLGVHVVDTALWMLGHPAVRQVHGRAFRKGEPLVGVGIDDFATARLELEGDVSAAIAVSWNAHAGADCVIRTTVYGTAGGAEFRNIAGSFFDFELVRFEGRQTRVVSREGREWLGRAIVDFCRELADSPRYRAAAEESVVVAQVVDATYGEAPAPSGQERGPAAGEVPQAEVVAGI